jgi:archaemetzincin
MKKSITFKELKVPNRINYYKQYNASEAIKELNKNLPKDCFLMIGLTTMDIYNREEWNFVYGLANPMESTGIFSFRRYIDEITILLKNMNKMEILIEYIIKFVSKVMLHEIGHLFGLKHCIYFNCKLNGSNHFEESAGHPFFLCPVCLRKIQWSLNFNIVDRYKTLLSTFKEINDDLYKEEIKWLENRLNKIC